MTFTRAIYASSLAAGIGLAGLVGVGVGTASADPWGRLVTQETVELGILVWWKVDSAETKMEGDGHAR